MRQGSPQTLLLSAGSPKPPARARSHTRSPRVACLTLGILCPCESAATIETTHVRTAIGRGRATQKCRARRGCQGNRGRDEPLNSGSAAACTAPLLGRRLGEAAGARPGSRGSPGVGATAAAMAHEGSVSFSSAGGGPQPESALKSVWGTMGRPHARRRPPTMRAFMVTKEATSVLGRKSAPAPRTLTRFVTLGT